MRVTSQNFTMSSPCTRSSVALRPFDGRNTQSTVKLQDKYLMEMTMWPNGTMVPRSAHNFPTTPKFCRLNVVHAFQSVTCLLAYKVVTESHTPNVAPSCYIVYWTGKCKTLSFLQLFHFQYINNLL